MSTHLPPTPWPGERQLVLASGSATRAAMLRAAGLSFDLRPVRIDEQAARDALIAEGTPARDIADALADQKARKAAGKCDRSALVLGADQVLDLQGHLLSKPASADDAMAQLLELSGKTHQLHSALVAYDGNEPVWRHVATATLTVRPLSPEFVRTYVSRNWPQIGTSVGSYQIEGDGIRLFSRIEGDFFTILGLPLLPLLTWLGARGDIAT